MARVDRLCAEQQGGGEGMGEEKRGEEERGRGSDGVYQLMSVSAAISLFCCQGRNRDLFVFSQSAVERKTHMMGGCSNYDMCWGLQ